MDTQQDQDLQAQINILKSQLTEMRLPNWCNIISSNWHTKCWFFWICSISDC